MAQVRFWWPGFRRRLLASLARTDPVPQIGLCGFPLAFFSWEFSPMRAAGATFSSATTLWAGITCSALDPAVCAVGVGLLMFDSADVEPETWPLAEPVLGVKWVSDGLAEGGELGALLCEALPLEEELAAEVVEMLGGALGADVGVGLGAALGGGLLGALDSWCCAKAIEEKRRTARQRLESRIRHLIPTGPEPTGAGRGCPGLF